MNSLPDFHDATLLDLHVAWADGALRLVIESELGKCRVLCNGLTSLKCPRGFPWGPSNSINRLWTEELVTGTRLLVEIQSGDLIEAVIKTVEVEASAL